MIKDFKFFQTPILYPKGYLRCEMEVYYYKDGWLSAEIGINISIADHFAPRIKRVWLCGYYNYLTYKEFGTIPRGI
jgi:hypothetical protein